MEKNEPLLEVANYTYGRNDQQIQLNQTHSLAMSESKVLTGIEIKTINHLGIVAGIIDELEIVELINQELRIDEQEIVNSGEIVKAIILNGLGFVSQPLYLFPKFF